MRTSVEERILLHLKNHIYDISDRAASHNICQQGIAESVIASLSQVSRTVRRMKKKGLIKEEKKYMEGDQERKRKVYSLTVKGAGKEKKVRSKLEARYFTLKNAEGEVKVKGSDLPSYIENNDPLLYALVNLNKRGVVELENNINDKGKSFVNRKKELSKLKSELKEVKKNRCKAIFIAGETGIGKTTLVKEFKNYALDMGFRFLEGRAHFESSEPYLPFKKAFDRHGQVGRKDKNKLDPRNLFDYQSSKKEEELFHDERHSAFFEFIKELRQQTQKSPHIISLDDLQWSDTATLELLFYIVNNLRNAPILFVCTYRPEEISRTHPFYNIRNRLSRQQKYQELTLKPFGLQNTRKLLYTLTNSSQLTDNLVQPIYKITEGIPLYIIEFTNLLVKEEDLSNSSLDLFTRDSLDIPKVVEDVIKRRLTIYTSKKGYNLLELGSVIGDDIDFELLVKCSRIDKRDLLDTIDELLKRDIWTEDPEESLYSFSHPLLNRVVYQDISEVKKEKLHLLVAENIIELYEGSINEYYSNISYHYEKGGRTELAVEYYLKAGEEAESVFAHEDAIKMYEKALDLVNEESEKRVPILEKLGQVNMTIGKYEESLQYFEKVLSDGTDQNLYLNVLQMKSDTFVNLGKYDEALDTIEECLSICDSGDSIRSKLLSSKGWIYLLKGDLDKAYDVFEEETKVAKDLGGKKDIGQAIHDLGTVELQIGNLDAALDSLNEALEIREDAKDINGMSATINNIGMIYWYKGDLDRTLDHYERSLKIRKKTGEKRYISMALNNIGIIHSSKGHFDNALRYHERSLEIKKSIGDKGGTAMSLVNIGNIYFERGNIDLALEYYERSLKIRESIGDKRGIAASISNIGMVHRHKNEFEEALAHYRKAIQICEKVGEKQTLIEIYSELGLTYTGIGEIETALDHAQKALELSVESGADAYKGHVHRILGIINREKGDIDTAEKELVRAKELLEGVGNIVDSTKAMYDLGTVMLENADLDRGKDLLEKAIERFEDMEMDIWIERCEKKMKDTF